MVAVQHSAMDDRIYFKEARSLASAGFEVHILTATHDGIPKDMTGKNILAADDLGIMFHAVCLPSSFLNKVLKRVSLGPFYAEMIAKAKAIQADIYVAHEPQSLLIARKASEATGASHLFDSHESLFFKNWKDKRAMSSEMERLPYFIAANSMTAESLAKMNPKASSEVIYNASIIEANTLPSKEELLIIHEGSLPFNRGLELMMDSLVLLKERKVDFNFRIVGTLNGEEKTYFDGMIRKHDLQDFIQVTGWVAYADLAMNLQGGAIGLILNTDTPNNRYGGPANKLFNYIAKGMMVIAVDLPETKRILRQYGAGITLKDRQTSTLADELQNILTDEVTRMEFRRNAVKAQHDLSWETQAKKLVSFYTKIIPD
jgi:glycosyltransferase involved in cell wall biosynthesis